MPYVVEMRDSGDSTADADNIITYIGVPLAVLGVLPILYNVLRTTRVYFAVRSRLAATKGEEQDVELSNDYFGGEVEVRLSTSRVLPLPRHESEYWKFSNKTQLPGGSWGNLTWRHLRTGNVSQRLKSVHQLRQLQVEVSFEDLILYLLDLGAIVYSPGWRALQATGIWTPKETVLLTTGEGAPILTIAALDGSNLDGKLSLDLKWQEGLVTRSDSLLAPAWVSLSSAGLDERLKEKTASRSTDEAEKYGSDTSSGVGISEEVIRFNIASDGQISIVPSVHNKRHLLTHRGRVAGSWLPTMFVAYAASLSQYTSYRIPEAMRNLAHSCVIQSGVLSLLGIVAGANSSPDVTIPRQKVDSTIDRNERLRRMEQERRDIQQAHTVQALQSKTWDIETISPHTLEYLNRQLNTELTLEEMSALILFQIVQDPDLVHGLDGMLRCWEEWSKNNGIGLNDLNELKQSAENIKLFAFSIILLKTIVDYENSTFAVMQSCLDTWKDVKLG